ncbi:type II toxin-antitoxin system RelE/ParE family toxin [Chromohalobacter canadensis]|uniref:type II toxin-antitoxin system RelE/ParE family toxin n=1 Tax=Chromohalobacter canadensis TaxID=141389 RepID=UPI002410817A|nr:type II toxin-antitoxin system RelE/ParE family toxin [Chromohalobacter canadensis]
MRIVWSPLALERVEDIAQYIAEDKPSVAVEWVESIFDTVERLADFPESGRIVPEVGGRRIREVIFGTYRIIYSVRDQIDILTVRHSSQLLRMSEIGDEET